MSLKKEKSRYAVNKKSPFRNVGAICVTSPTRSNGIVRQPDLEYLHQSVCNYFLNPFHNGFSTLVPSPKAILNGPYFPQIASPIIRAPAKL